MSRDNALFHHKEIFGTRGDECLRATELASVAGFSGIYFFPTPSINQSKKKKDSLKVGQSPSCFSQAIGMFHVDKLPAN